MSSLEYQQLKFKGKFYSVGDNIVLRESNGKVLICKLLEIIPTGGIPTFEEWPSIRVQWYYHSSDLDLPSLGIKESDQIYLAENELFYSDHSDVVYIGSIIGKCDVYTIDDYDRCETVDDNTYYSRSMFITKESRLEPPFNKWKTLCSCNKPMNPNLLTIGCDKCGNWYHPICEGIDPEKAKDIDYFECLSCKSRISQRNY